MCKFSYNLLTYFISSWMYGRQVQFIGSNNLEKTTKTVSFTKIFHRERCYVLCSSEMCKYVHSTVHLQPIRWHCSHVMCRWYTLITKNTSRAEDKTLLIRAIKIIQTNLQAINLELATEKTELILIFRNSPRLPQQIFKWITLQFTADQQLNVWEFI